MDNETIEIKRENVMAAYKEARKNGYTPLVNTLEALFGIETFKPKDVKERIKTFEDACNELGEEHPFVKDWQYWQGGTKDLRAYLKLRIITAALNEGWEPQFTEEESRWYPYFVLARSFGDSSAGGGVAYADAVGGASYAYAGYGSRLAFKTYELAVYAGRQFIDIWADYVFKPGEKGGK